MPSHSRRAAPSSPHERSSGVFAREAAAAVALSRGVKRATWDAAPLLCAAGACAAVYLQVWSHELALIWMDGDTSSLAPAVFCASFAAGARFWSERLEMRAEPLRAYASLQLLCTLAAIASALLWSTAQQLYAAISSSADLSGSAGAGLRLGLCALVLGLPAWLMGGMLPALARAAPSQSSQARAGQARAIALVALGAAIGCVLTNTVLFDALGVQRSYYAACALNALACAAAYLLASRDALAPPSATQAELAARPQAAALEAAHMPAPLTQGCAVLLGGASMLSALLASRVLAPLIGSSDDARTALQVVALSALSLGSAGYAASHRERPMTALGFACSCGVYAMSSAVPYALADQLAEWTALSRAFASLGRWGLWYSWLQLACLTLLPAALLLGALVAASSGLLGRGPRFEVRDVGAVCAAWAVGAAAGALVGPLLFARLGVLACWRWSSAVVMLLGLVLGLRYVARSPRRRHGMWLVTSAATVALCLLSDGPSALARHAPIGAGAVALASIDTPNKLLDFARKQRRSLLWENDAEQHTLGLARDDGLRVLVDGAPAAHVQRDAPTQIMAGLLAAALHPDVKRALVIGLGDGVTAGWLARLPELERVDVSEPQPALLTVAQLCSRANLGALENPKLQLHARNARQWLNAANGGSYDVIVWDPGPAPEHMPAHELCELAGSRLARGGIFVARVPARDLDPGALQRTYATLLATFPHVQTWHGLRDDLLLLAAYEPLLPDAPRLRARLSVEPFAAALRVAWHTEGLEGFLSHHVASAALSPTNRALNVDDAALAALRREPNSDGSMSAPQRRRAARLRGYDRPQLGDAASVDWQRVEFERQAFVLISGAPSDETTELSASYRARLAVLTYWSQARYSEALSLWSWLAARDPALEPRGIERVALAELLAYRGDEHSMASIARLLPAEPTLVLALQAVWLSNHEALEDGAEHILQALEHYRADPWPYPASMARSIELLARLHNTDALFGPSYLRALAEPFALYVNDDLRERTALSLALALGPSNPACLPLMASFEPFAPWSEPALEYRLACYTAHAHPLRKTAAADLERFRNNTPNH